MTEPASWECGKCGEAIPGDLLLGRPHDCKSDVEREHVLSKDCWCQPEVVSYRGGVEELRALLREWRAYTNLRARIEASDDPTEYETGRELLRRTDEALDA